MRCTTELTAHFDLNMNLIGSPDLEAFLNDDSELGSIEYWEAFEREEMIKMRGEEGLLDALDFDTVPFESVVEDLSLELFEQDAAEDRAMEYDVCKCKKCGLEDEWDDGHLTFIAGEFRCKKCMPKGHGEITIMQELHRKRQMREQNIRAARAVKFRAALETARKLRPDLNWARYEYDPRRYA